MPDMHDEPGSGPQYAATQGGLWGLTGLGALAAIFAAPLWLILAGVGATGLGVWAALKHRSKHKAGGTDRSMKSSVTRATGPSRSGSAGGRGGLLGGRAGRGLGRRGGKAGSGLVAGAGAGRRRGGKGAGTAGSKGLTGLGRRGRGKGRGLTGSGPAGKAPWFARGKKAKTGAGSGSGRGSTGSGPGRGRKGKGLKGSGLGGKLPWFSRGKQASSSGKGSGGSRGSTARPGRGRRNRGGLGSLKSPWFARGTATTQHKRSGLLDDNSARARKDKASRVNGDAVADGGESRSTENKKHSGSAKGAAATSNGGHAMGKYDDVAEAFHRAATNFDTSSAKGVEQHFKDMQELFQGMARSLGVSKGYLEDNFSVDQAVPDTMSSQAQAMGRMAEEQELLSGTYRRRHEADFSRIEDPRRHEKAWDYTTNQDDA